MPAQELLVLSRQLYRTAGRKFKLVLACTLPCMGNSRIMELERRVDLALKGMNLLLFVEAESIPPREKKELQRRLKDYAAGRRSESVELKELQGTVTQESS